MDDVHDAIIEHEWQTPDGKTRRFTDKQARLIDLVAVQGMSVERAAREAGYATTTIALTTLRRPEVRAVCEEMVKNRLSLLAPLAIKTLSHLLNNARSEKVKLDAVNTVLTLTGHGVTAPQASAQGMSITINLGDSSED